MLGYMSVQDDICSDIFQTLVEIYTVVLHFGSDTCQIKLWFVQIKSKSAHMSDFYFMSGYHIAATKNIH